MKKHAQEQGANTTTTRRTFIKTVGVVGAATMLPGAPWISRARAQALPGGSLDPASIPKYRSKLFVLPTMPRSGTVADESGMVDYYEIAARQFQQQVLPPGMPATTILGYGSLTAPGIVANGGSFSWPAFTVEAKVNQPIQVKWINDLKDPRTGGYFPPLLPVDQTLHWANPPGPRDDHTLNPNFYTGPMPLVPHLHGAHSDDDSDGFPEAWFLPAASNIPVESFRVGSAYELFKSQFQQKHGVVWAPGTATFRYNNDQEATTLWYHDHTLGLTRVNVYAGLAGFYLLRSGPDDLPVGLPGGTPNGRTNPLELPLLIQDRSFNTDGSLFYPESREFFDGFAGPYVPDSDIPPIWNAEFFGNVMTVNGKTWPYLEVEQRRYRLRLLNGCNSRFVILKLSNGLPFWRIGSDGGFLPGRVMQDEVLLGPAERADVIVDFSKAPTGTNILMLNLGPDEPFGGGSPGVDFAPSDPDTTGQVMQFRVIASTSADTSIVPLKLQLPPQATLRPPDVRRQVSFNELDSAVLPGVGPLVGLLGTADLSNPAAPAGVPLRWSDNVTETPVRGTTELWEIFNFTEDAHPCHLHQVQFQIINRQAFDPASRRLGRVRGPERWETGRKDTVVVFPGEVTRVKAFFDLAGLYVWHCHILEHEDNEMMRPLQVMVP